MASGMLVVMMSRFDVERKPSLPRDEGAETAFAATDPGDAR